MTDDDRLDLAALEDTIRERAAETAWARYDNAEQFEQNRQRRGGRPRPIPVPKPVGWDEALAAVSFTIIRVIPEPTPEELRRARASKRVTAKRRADGKRARPEYLANSAAARVRALHREAPTLSTNALAEKLGISRRAVQHALAPK